MKKNMDALTKAKLFYSGELLVFAIVFLVIAILKFVDVIHYNATRMTIFNWITIFGGTWMLVDFFWALFSKKRRPKIALIDKIIHLPIGLYLITFDLYCLISQTKDELFCRLGVAILLSYLFLCYTFEAIYHFFHPIPGLLDAVTEVEEDKPEETEPKEENNNEEKQ